MAQTTSGRRSSVVREAEGTASPASPERPWGDRPLASADLLTKEQVAALLGLRPSTVDDLRRRGELPAIHLGRHRRFLHADVERFVVANREEARR